MQVKTKVVGLKLSQFSVSYLQPSGENNFFTTKFLSYDQQY